MVNIKIVLYKIRNSLTPVSDAAGFFIKSMRLYPKNVFINGDIKVKDAAKIRAKGLLLVVIESNKIGVDLKAKGLLLIHSQGQLVTWYYRVLILISGKSCPPGQRKPNGCRKPNKNLQYSSKLMTE